MQALWDAGTTVPDATATHLFLKIKPIYSRRCGVNSTGGSRHSCRQPGSQELRAVGLWEPRPMGNSLRVAAGSCHTTIALQRGVCYSCPGRGEKGPGQVWQWVR